MDNLFNNEMYYEKLDSDKILEYINKLQTVVVEVLNEKDNYGIKYINVGIKTVLHIMYIIFINTKNIDVTSYYGKTSMTYYFEFINQISSKNTNDYINMTLQDAIIFVYKKTIFNLNSDYKNNNNNYNDDIILKQIFTINDIINMLHIYNNYSPIKYKNIIEKIITISNNVDIYVVKQIISLLIDNNINIIKIFNFVNTLSKKKKIIINNSNIYKYNYNNYNVKSYLEDILST
jgi:hypothetical protein